MDAQCVGSQLAASRTGRHNESRIEKIRKPNAQAAVLIRLVEKFPDTPQRLDHKTTKMRFTACAKWMGGADRGREKAALEQHPETKKPPGIRQLDLEREPVKFPVSSPKS